MVHTNDELDQAKGEIDAEQSPHARLLGEGHDAQGSGGGDEGVGDEMLMLASVDQRSRNGLR